MSVVLDASALIAMLKGEKGATILAQDTMPGARFFPEARLNFAENLLARNDAQEAIVFRGEDKSAQRLTFAVSDNGVPEEAMVSERRYYPERDTVTTEAGIRMGFLSNLHLTSGEDNGTGKGAGKDKGTGRAAQTKGKGKSWWSIYLQVKTARMHALMLEDELQKIEDEMEAMPYI